METTRIFHSNLSYLKRLAGAGWQAVASVRQEATCPVFTQALKDSAWWVAAAGATLGLAVTHLRAKPRRASTAALGGMVGSVLGLGAAAAWGSREFTKTAAHRAVRQVNAARDAHWLELNPIDYA